MTWRLDDTSTSALGQLLEQAVEGEPADRWARGIGSEAGPFVLALGSCRVPAVHGRVEHARGREEERSIRAGDDALPTPTISVSGSAWRDQSVFGESREVLVCIGKCNIQFACYFWNYVPAAR